MTLRRRGRLASRGKQDTGKGPGSPGPASPGDRATKLLARACAETIVEKKGENVILLDLRGVSSVCDFFVLASGVSEPHVLALSEEVRDRLEEEMNLRPWHVEGASGRRWILLDYVDWVVHIFHKETRDYYQLERLWRDAPMESFTP